MLDKKDLMDCLDAAITSPDDYCRGWNDAVDAMPKWISVEERLPDRNEKVVVTDGVHTWDYGEFSGLAYSFARKGEGNPHEWNWKKHTVRTVNWWMPKKNALPEPPKED